MRLKSLIIKGFKTFADKEELGFDSPCGITAIVGPNGCGKSNVVDSFRFALGESNLRNLRVLTHPEVIFAGTEGRKPLSLAEVTINIDNSDHSLPVEYSELQVRRRTFRDGESEFSINNQPVRLKDIRDLFLDSGLSGEALSIMSQGRVDAILSSKPEERRAVFEEAAGINKYKVRKLEAEKKLIMSEQNLLRISDLKVEVGEQLIQLESQAKSAREYKSIQEKLKEIELSTYKKQARQLLEKKEEITKELDDAKRQIEQKEEQRKKLLEDKISKSQTLRQIETQIDEMSNFIGSIKDKIEAERGSMVIERERLLYEEKGKLRDLKEEQRFIEFEIKRIEADFASLNRKKEELLKKSREIQSEKLDEFGDFKEIIKNTVELSRILQDILVKNFGKSWNGLKDEASSEFKKLIDMETARIDDEIAGSKEELDFKRRQLEQITLKIAPAGQQLDELTKTTEAFLKSPSGGAVDRLIKEKQENDQKLAGMRKEREKLTLDLEQMERSSMDDFSQIGIAPDITKKEVALARIELELAQIESRAREDYNISYEELLSYPNEAPNISKCRKDSEAMKARLRELEPVNLLAIEEYEKCLERNTFIETQHHDMVGARENLKTLIIELDLKAREDFLKTMEKLAKNFKEVFSDLFLGGEAQIEMEKDKDALDAGIEITVRPNGRKWLNLSLLSGGERALTAIALLFAILRTSPSPLCILDEVDAALDDANVVRFASYLKKFSETSQILVITHNKRTMVAADSIYGVTMEEPGVSKVISVKLEKTV